MSITMSIVPSLPTAYSPSRPSTPSLALSALLRSPRPAAFASPIPTLGNNRIPQPGELWFSSVDLCQPVVQTASLSAHAHAPGWYPGQLPENAGVESGLHPCIVLGDLPGARCTVAPLGTLDSAGGGTWDEMMTFFVVPVSIGGPAPASSLATEVQDDVVRLFRNPLLPFKAGASVWVGQSTILRRAALVPGTSDVEVQRNILARDGVRALLLLCARRKLEFRRLPKAKVQAMWASYAGRLAREKTGLDSPPPRQISPRGFLEALPEEEEEENEADRAELAELGALAKDIALSAMRPSMEGSPTRRAMQQLRRVQAQQLRAGSRSPSPVSDPNEDAPLPAPKQDIPDTVKTTFGFKGRSITFDWSPSPSPSSSPASSPPSSPPSSPRSSPPPLPPRSKARRHPRRRIVDHASREEAATFWVDFSNTAATQDDSGSSGPPSPTVVKPRSASPKRVRFALDEPVGNL